MVVKKDSKRTDPKLRIRLKSYDLNILASVMKKIVGLLEKSNAKIKWPINLPKKRKVFTVLKAPFVYKDSREQFERITYTRLIDVAELGDSTVEYLRNLQVPVGVLVKISWSLLQK